MTTRPKVWNGRQNEPKKQTAKKKPAEPSLPAEKIPDEADRPARLPALGDG